MQPVSNETSYEVIGSVDHRGLRPAIFFDGDDTLWLTEHLYDEARERAAHVVAVQGLDKLDWVQRERRIDVANVPRFGLSAERFPTSCVEAYKELCTAAGQRPTAAVVRDVWAAAESVFQTPAPPVPHVEATLKTLWPEHSLFLLTQGDPVVQERRIGESGLQHLFDGVFVTPRKSQEVLRAVVGKLGVDVSDAVFVGNSVASDINPALSVGMRAVWIDAHVWDHERREVLSDLDGLIVGQQLGDLPKLLAMLL
jgi:putative hydrolase of the HAD superfamily